MWARNLLFIAVSGAALAIYVASFVPHKEPPRPQAPRADRQQPDAFRAIVERIDASFQTDWADRNLQPADPAPDLQVARRLSLALTGTVPSLQEIRDFEAHAADDRLEWFTAGILADGRCHDYLAERFARAFVGTQDGPFLIFRRRRFVSWLAQELKQNRPYDQLVRQLIATDGLWTDKPSTNFITVAIKPGNEDKGPDETVLAARVSRAFLGIRIDCAECHDHPFEPWKQADFQHLAAFFGKTEQTLTGIREQKKRSYSVEDRSTGEVKVVPPRVPYAHELVPEQGNARQRLAAWVTHPANVAFSRAVVNRVWALMFGRALIEPVDNLRLNDPVPKPLQLLADDFVAHGHDLQRLIQVIAATRAFRLDSKAPLDAAGNELPGRALTPEHEEAWAVFPMTRLRPEQVVGGLLQAGQLATIDYNSHIIIKLARAAGQQEFVERYGDAGEDELESHGGTIPQRLVMMNGNIVKERTESEAGPLLLGSAAPRIALLAPNSEKAVEAAYLAVLTRRPTAEEAAHFEGRLSESRGDQRFRMMEDLYWDLLNSTEFSWNH